MKLSSLSIVLFVLLVLESCSSINKESSIKFIPIDEKDLNFTNASFAIPHGAEWDERMKWHDSCMGSSFQLNAVFFRTKSSIILGSIVNKKTMQVVNTFSPIDSGVGGPSLNLLSFMAKPCYEKRPINISIESFLKGKLLLKIPGADEKINNELNDAIANSVNTEVETGSWLNLELTDAIGKMLDTTTNESKLEYKKLLLDTNNIILVRSSGITDITFHVHTTKNISEKLQTLLKQKPAATSDNILFKPQLFFISEDSFDVTLKGYFLVFGQFMRCELQ